MVVLGTITEEVRQSVQKLVDVARAKHMESDGPFRGILLWAGPGGAEYLDADGEMWGWSVFDDSIEHVADGPRKVGGIVIAAESMPELSAWLPRRPMDAFDCQACMATGWLQPPRTRLLCPTCNGLGWVVMPPSTA